MTVTLQGKAIIVTGAGQGVGAAVAKCAARLGAQVLVNDIDAALAEAVVAEIRSGGGDAAANGADLSVWASGQALVEACLAAFGRLDGLFNNAGVLRVGTFDALTEEDMLATFRVNVLGVASCAQAAARHMVAQGAGAIVNATSGAQCGLAGHGAYGASKGAVASLTYALAVELRETGVRVNAISPRAWTRMAELTRSTQPNINLTFPTADEIAPAICFLLSDAAGDIHGQVVRIDQGLLGLMTHPAVLAPTAAINIHSIEEVSRAFSEDLSGRQQALGIVKVACQLA